MSWLFKLLDSAGVNQAGVDSGGQVKAVLSSTASTTGYVRNADRDGNAAQFSDHGRQKVGMENFLFYDSIDGAVINTNLWGSSQATMTQAISAGFLVLNSAASTAINTYSIINSIRVMPFLSHYPLYWHVKAKTPNIPEANATIELGMGSVATTAAPTDGVFFRWATDGVFYCVVNNAGVETITAVTAPTINATHTFAIVYGHNSARFEIDGSIVATVSVATGLSSLTSTARLVNFARVYNGGSIPSVAPQLFVAEWCVAQMDVNWGKPWGEALASIGRGAYQSPLTAFGQTANHANSTSPASATLSNTAAGYTTLGGRFQFAAVVGAATDFALFGYQVPAGYQLVVKSIRIDSIVTVVAIATTPTVLDWAIGVNSSAVSLATVDGAGTWAPRRIPIGIQGYALVAPNGPKQPGESGEMIDAFFDPPLIVDSGRFFHVILQVPIGTATATQIFRGDVMVSGYFE